MYLERRIQASIHGSEAHIDFSAIRGWKALGKSPDHILPGTLLISSRGVHRRVWQGTRVHQALHQP